MKRKALLICSVAAGRRVVAALLPWGNKKALERLVESAAQLPADARRALASELHWLRERRQRRLGEEIVERCRRAFAQE